MPHKIGIICFPTYGGSGIIASELGKHLLQNNHEVHFISSGLPIRLNLFQSNLYYHEVDTYVYPLFENPHYVLAMASKIVEIAKSYHLDLLHVHYAIPHAAAAYLARETLRSENISLPIITTLHGTDISLVGQDKQFTPIVRFCINVSDAVTAVSNALCQETLEYFKPTRKIQVIYNFVEVDHFQVPVDLAQKRKICQEEKYILLHISNMRKVKRISDVIKVFLKVQQQLPSHLIIIGDGPERAKAEELCHSHNIRSKVHFFGKTSFIRDVLRMADLLLVTSTKESFGLAALEAMAAHTPVIATQAGGLPELIEDQKSGFICPIGDIDMMVEKSLHILQPAHLDSFKEAAFERAKRFDSSHIVPQYEKLYEDVLAKAETEETE